MFSENGYYNPNRYLLLKQMLRKLILPHLMGLSLQVVENVLWNEKIGATLIDEISKTFLAFINFNRQSNCVNGQREIAFVGPSTV